MKILIKGYSGSGKSTFAKILGKHYNIPVLHLDSIHFKKNWEERNDDEFDSIVQKFIKDNESWIIDGNYTKIAKQRNEIADMTFFFDFNRFFCLKSVISRYHKYKGKTREDMAEGCNEKIDFSFLWWVFYKGRTKKRKRKHQEIIRNNKNVVVFKNRKQVHIYCKNKKIMNPFIK